MDQNFKIIYRRYTSYKIKTAIRKAQQQKIEEISKQITLAKIPPSANDQTKRMYIIQTNFIFKISPHLQFIKSWPIKQISATDLTYSNGLNKILQNMFHIKFENLQHLNLFYLKIDNIEPLSLVFSPNLRTIKIDQNKSNFSITPLARSAFKKLQTLRINQIKLTSDKQHLVCNRGYFKQMHYFSIEEKFNQINPQDEKNYGGSMITHHLFQKSFSFWMSQPHLLIKSDLPIMQDKKVDRNWFNQNIAYYDSRKNTQIFNIGIRNKRGLECFLQRFTENDDNIQIYRFGEQQIQGPNQPNQMNEQPQEIDEQPLENPNQQQREKQNQQYKSYQQKSMDLY